MSITLRLLLILGSIVCFVFVIRKIRKTQMRIESSVFWILFSLFIVLIAVFPQILIYGANEIGVESPVNFVYLIILFIMLVELFMLSIKVSYLESKLNSLVQQIALRERAEQSEE